jgi:DNA replication protein DnaC
MSRKIKGTIMETSNIQAAQEKPEENQASSRQMDQTPTSLADEDPSYTPQLCPDCGGELTRVPVGRRTYEVCPPCTEKLRLEVEANERERERKEEEATARYRQNLITRNLKDCNIGERFKGLTFEDYKPTCPKSEKVFMACCEYVETFAGGSGASLLMMGSPGTGKTMLAAIIGQEIIKRHFSFRHTTAMQLVRRVKDSWRKDSDESEQGIIDSFVKPALLVIDEIGVQFGSPTEQLFLTEVINDRYELRRPTILMSNLTLSQVTETMGARVIDRFRDDGSKFLVFDWLSYRGNKG